MNVSAGSTSQPSNLAAGKTQENQFSPGSLLRLNAIEGKPKPVFLASDFAKNVSKYASDADLLTVTTIKSRIIAGSDLLAYYRSSSRADDLLANHGVMHLHLSSPASKALLYLMQFENCVLFLRVWSHLYVDERPAGKTLQLASALREFAELLARLRS